MKVKKKYLIIVGAVVFSLFLIFSALFFYMLDRFDLNFRQGSKFIASGFSFNPAENDELLEYVDPNQYKIDVLHYNINIDLFPSKEMIECKTLITGIPKSNFGGEIVLNFNDGFEITELKLNNEVSTYVYDNGKIIISASKEVLDTFKIQIIYSGTPESLGFGSFVFGEYKEEPVVYTLNEPIFASTWFPCIKIIVKFLIKINTSFKIISSRHKDSYISAET